MRPIGGKIYAKFMEQGVKGGRLGRFRRFLAEIWENGRLLPQFISLRLLHGGERPFLSRA